MARRDLPERQRTLRDTIRWSYDLLPVPARDQLRRVAVFKGGFDLAAAAAVTGAETYELVDGLVVLVQHHMLRVVKRPHSEEIDNARYDMLETIREFGVAELEASGETRATRDAHAAWCLGLAEAAAMELTGPDQVRWFDRLEVEHDNLRAALEWAASRPGDGGLRMAAALWRFWWVRGHSTEGRAWLDRVITHDRGGLSGARAAALHAAAELAESQADYDRAEDLFERAHAEREIMGDWVGQAECWNGLGIVARATGRLERAESLHEQALEVLRTAGDQRSVAVSLSNLAAVAFYRGDLSTAGDLWDEVVGIVRTLGDQRAAGAMLGNVGAVRLAEGDTASAVGAHEEALAIASALNDVAGMAHALANLGEALAILGELERAEAVCDESLTLSRQVGEPRTEAVVLQNMGKLAQSRGDLALAAERYDESLALFSAAGEVAGIAGCLERVAGLAVRLGDHERGVRLFGAAAEMRDRSGTTPEGQDQCSITLPLDAARGELGSGAHTAAWEEGRAQSPDATSLDVSAVVSSAALTLSPPRRSPATPNVAGLTARELEVVLHLVRRRTDPEIAAELFISPRTVATHVSAILRKLGVSSRRDVADAVARFGIQL